MASTDEPVTANPLSIPPGLNTPDRSFAEFASGLTTGKSVDGATRYEDLAAYPTPVFGESATVPVLTWKSAPRLGHLMGFAKRGDNTPLDTATVIIENLYTKDKRTTATDGNGFYGGTDLAPGQYLVKTELGSEVLYSRVATVTAGRVTTANVEFALAPNPIDDAQFFVRQHYLDFLNREPDHAGLQFWADQITSCGTDAVCVEVKRINVSAAFFLSIEFQQTGFFIYRLYQSAFGTGPSLGMSAFLADAQQIGNGVVVGQADWEQKLEANRQAFTSAFAERQAFLDRYPQSVTSEQFVDALNRNTGESLSQAERDALVADLTSGAKTRAQVLRAVAEDADFARREFNPAFVYMQYVGYLRRAPADPPDNSLDGFNFWLAKLNSHNGDFVSAEMVKSFIVSGDYRSRFGR
jgi:hypothetical protein